MSRAVTARVTAVAFGVELLFALVIPVAFVHLFDIDDGEDCRTVFAMVAAVYVVRTTGLVAWLSRLLRPIDHWCFAARSEEPEAALTQKAARAAYDSPLLFSLGWATSWLLFYLPVTLALRAFFPERIPLAAEAVGATLLFGVSCFAAALPLSYAILGWLLGPVAGRISLSARARGLPLPGRRASLRTRLVVLCLSLIVAPTAWMGLTAYMSQLWTAQRESAARAQTLAESLERRLNAAADRESRDAVARSVSTPFDVAAVAAADGTFVSNADAARELEAAPGLRFRLARSISRGAAGAVLDPHVARSAAWRPIASSGPHRTLAVVISHGPGNYQRGEVVSLLLFALIALSWAPVCAFLLAGSIAVPLERIRSVVSQIVVRGDVDELGRIPVFHRDEIGELAQGANEMIDRLHESAGRIRRYVEDREHLLAEAARRAAQLDAVMENMVEGVFACDRQGTITHKNAAAERLLKLSPALGDSRGTMADGAARPRHRDGQPLSAAELPLVRALAGEVIVEEDEVLENPSSQRSVFLRSSAAPIRDANGAIAGAVSVARDVTEVVELDRLKDQFLRVAAHELKTPVAILKGYALTLMRTDETLSPRSRQMLAAIDRGAERIHRIVSDLVDVSQAFLDVLRVSPKTVDLDELVRAEVGSLPTTDRHAVLVLRTDAGPLPVRADPARTRQALANLLNNAIKYSPAGGTIEVALGAGHSRGEAFVSVRDHGVGIPPQAQERIFQLFYSAHTDTPHDYGGMGVGLYMARELIKRQGGRMWFESREGEGSTFAFTLPLADEVVAA